MLTGSYFPSLLMQTDPKWLPHGGRPRDDMAPGLRTVPFERVAVVAYLVEDDLVRFTDVFYGGRDFEALTRDHPTEE